MNFYPDSELLILPLPSDSDVSNVKLVKEYEDVNTSIVHIVCDGLLYTDGSGDADISDFTIIGIVNIVDGKISCDFDCASVLDFPSYDMWVDYKSPNRDYSMENANESFKSLLESRGIDVTQVVEAKILMVHQDFLSVEEIQSGNVTIIQFMCNRGIQLTPDLHKSFSQLMIVAESIAGVNSSEIDGVNTSVFRFKHMMFHEVIGRRKYLYRRCVDFIKRYNRLNGII